MSNAVMEKEFCEVCLDKLLARAKRPDERQVDEQGRPILTSDEVYEVLDRIREDLAAAVPTEHLPNDFIEELYQALDTWGIWAGDEITNMRAWEALAVAYLAFCEDPEKRTHLERAREMACGLVLAAERAYDMA